MKHTLLLAVTVFAFAAGCTSNGAKQDSTPVSGKPIVEMETTAGKITLELDADKAPISTTNFLEHAKKGHYDGTIFHRVIPTFVVQGGGWTIEMVEKAKQNAAAGRPDVPIKNEWQNGLKNVKYSIAMARESDPDSATREFYINVADNARLDSARTTTGNAGYAVFGKVIGGFETIETIRTGATGPRRDLSVTDGSMENVPLKPVTVTHVRRVR